MHRATHYEPTTLCLHAAKGMRESLIGEDVARAALNVLSAGGVTVEYEGEPLSRIGVLVTVDEETFRKKDSDITDIEVVAIIRTSINTLIDMFCEQFGPEAVTAALDVDVETDPNTDTEIIH